MCKCSEYLATTSHTSHILVMHGLLRLSAHHTHAWAYDMGFQTMQELTSHTPRMLT